MGLAFVGMRVSFVPDSQSKVPSRFLRELALSESLEQWHCGVSRCDLARGVWRLLAGAVSCQANVRIGTLRWLELHCKHCERVD